MEYLQHILRHWVDDRLVDLDQVLRAEAVVLEMPQRPIPLSEAALDDLKVGRDRRLTGEVPAQHLQLGSRLDPGAVSITEVSFILSVKTV